jgi:hypothetical protein
MKQEALPVLIVGVEFASDMQAARTLLQLKRV